jgi:hypothetical protein
VLISRDGVNLRGTQLLDAQGSQPLAHVDRLLKRLASDQAGNEATSKGIASAVGVVDLLLGNGVDGEGLDLIDTLLGDDGRLSTLGDDGETGTLAVGLGQVGQVLGNDGNVGLVAREAVRLGVGSGLALVADDVVPVFGRRV